MFLRPSKDIKLRKKSSSKQINTLSLSNIPQIINRKKEWAGSYRWTRVPEDFFFPDFKFRLTAHLTLSNAKVYSKVTLKHCDSNGDSNSVYIATLRDKW